MPLPPLEEILPTIEPASPVGDPKAVDAQSPATTLPAVVVQPGDDTQSAIGDQLETDPALAPEMIADPYDVPLEDWSPSGGPTESPELAVTEDVESLDPEASRETETDTETPLESAVELDSPALESAPETEMALDLASAEPALRTTPPMGRITDVDVQDARTAAFNGVTPGLTTVEQLQELLGAPSAKGKEEGEYPSLLYQLGPFPKVEFVLHNEVVNSVIVTLPEAAAPDLVARELKIGQFRSTAIFDSHGELLGYVFPERGILLNLDDNGKTVSQIMIEPVRAEFFVIRARNDAEQQYRLNLADLNYAIQLDPTNAEAYWLKSKIFTELGRYKDALQLAEYAVERAPRDRYYKLQQAKLVALNGDFHRAEMIVDRILSDENAPVLVQARAQCLMGDLLASGPKQDLSTACEHHRAAIALAAPYWTDQRHEASRMAVQVLIDANLAVANDVAWGRWSKKDEVVPKWLETAANVIDAQAGNNRLDSLLTLQMYRRSLMAFAGLPGDNNYREIAEAAHEEAASLIAASDDWLFKNRVEWELGEALYQSMRCALKDGNQEKALEFAQRSIGLVEQSDDVRQITTHQEFVYGQLYYLTGSIHALAHDDHQEAVSWYRKAAPYLTANYPRDVVSNPGLLGDQIVSIGVSYWKTDNRQDAINITKEGVSLIRKAIAEGQREEQSLSIPYSNLATMYKLLGDTDQSSSFARLAARLKDTNVASQKETQDR